MPKGGAREETYNVLRDQYNVLPLTGAKYEFEYRLYYRQGPYMYLPARNRAELRGLYRHLLEPRKYQHAPRPFATSS